MIRTRTSSKSWWSCWLSRIRRFHSGSKLWRTRPHRPPAMHEDRRLRGRSRIFDLLRIVFSTVCSPDVLMAKFLSFFVDFSHQVCFLFLGTARLLHPETTVSSTAAQLALSSRPSTPASCSTQLLRSNPLSRPTSSVAMVAAGSMMDRTSRKPPSPTGGKEIKRRIVGEGSSSVELVVLGFVVFESH